MHRPSPRQESFVQGSLSLQSKAVMQGVHPATGSKLQTPPMHKFVVHALPSLQFRLLVHLVQPMISAYTHTPEAQVSLEHGSPSSQSVTVRHEMHPEMGLFLHPVAVSHESVVHGLASSQMLGLPALQAPFRQASLLVHALPSLQASVLFVYAHPVEGSHESVVHGLASSQTLSELEQPGPTAPCIGVSSQTSSVQGFPSSQNSTKDPNIVSHFPSKQNGKTE